MGNAKDFSGEKAKKETQTISKVLEALKGLSIAEAEDILWKAKQEIKGKTLV